MQIKVEMPDKIIQKETTVIREERRTGVKKRLEKEYRTRLNNRYSPLKIPLCCTYCAFAGEPIRHCKCPNGPRYGINVSSFDVCSHWQPNQGLLMFLQQQEWKVHEPVIRRIEIGAL